MDKEWVRQAVEDHLCCEGPHVSSVDVAGMVAAIVAQHEEELAKMEHRYQQANQMDRDTAGMARLDMEKAQAQLALMAEALQGLCKAVWYGTDDDRQAAYDKAQLVLSAAPKVAARLKMQLRREPMGGRYLGATGQDSYLAMGMLRYDETYDVLVMTGGQPQSSEQSSGDALQMDCKGQRLDGEEE